MSLVTDEIRGWLGREVTYTAPEPISAAAFRYFGQAIGDDNPLYTDPGFAREHGYEDVVAPPTLICETNQYANLPKNSHGFAGHLWDLKIEGCRLVRGGNSYRFHRPVYPSDIVTAKWTLTGIEEREQSNGKPMVVVESTAEYTNSDGELLATNVETVIWVKR